MSKPEWPTSCEKDPAPAGSRNVCISPFSWNAESKGYTYESMFGNIVYCASLSANAISLPAAKGNAASPDSNPYCLASFQA